MKGRPFWSRVLSVRLNPSRKDTLYDIKYIGLDVHKESIEGLHGELQVTFEEGTSSAWLYDLLRPRVTKLVVCDPRKYKSMREGNPSDKIDARRLAEQLPLDHLNPVCHSEHGLRTLKEMDAVI
jgi:hypothetical protein